MKKGILAKILSMAFVSAVLPLLSLSSVSYATENNGTVGNQAVIQSSEEENEQFLNLLSNQTPVDLFSFDINEDIDIDSLDLAIMGNKASNVAAWLSTLTDDEISFLIEKGSMLGKPYSIDEVGAQAWKLSKTQYNTALEFYNLVKDSGIVNDNWTASNGVAKIIFHDNSGQKSDSTVTVSVSGMKKNTDIGDRIKGSLLWAASGATVVGDWTGKDISPNWTWKSAAGDSDNYYIGLCYLKFTNADITSGTSYASQIGPIPNRWFNLITTVEKPGTGLIKGSNYGWGGNGFGDKTGIFFVNLRYMVGLQENNANKLTINYNRNSYSLNYNNYAAGSTQYSGTGYCIPSTASAKYTQTFNTNGGSNVAPIDVTQNNLQSWDCRGITHAKGKKLDDIVIEHNFVSGSNISFSPIWGSNPSFTAPNSTGVEYTLTYNTGGSSVGRKTLKSWSSGNTSISPGQTVNVDKSNNWVANWNNPIVKTAPAPSKIGYRFNGWDIGGKTYNPGADVTLTANTTATANWTANTYTVKLDSNGGTLSGSDTINAVYDKAFDLPIPEKAPTTVGSNANGEDEVTTTYSFNGWACPAGTFSGSAKNLTAVNGETVTMVAQWVEAKTTKQYISDSPTPPQEPDIVINQVDTEKLNDILKKIDSLKKIADLSADDIKNLKTVVASISGMDQSTASKLIDLISGSSALTDAQKLTLLKHLANGYLTDEDRLLLRTIVGSSALSTADKDKILKAISAFSYLSYDEQKKLLDALNAGSSATFKTGDGVEYIFTKGADGMLTVALKSLNGITDLVVPNSVTLAGTTFPVTKIAPNTFKGNTALKSVTIPGNVSEIGESAFEGCLGLEKVNTTNGLITIGDKAFKDCKSLTSFACPASLKTIGNSAFEGCTKLSTITLNEGLITIGNRAFYGCSALTKVVIPRTVLKIGSSAFEKCTKLKTVTFASYATAQCQTIGAKAFKGDKALTGIKLPKKINKIQKSTFSGCKKLKSVKGMAGVTDIGASAFANCKSLKSITLQKKLQTIGSKAFYGCKKLKTVNIKSKAVTKVGSKAFKKCKKGIGFKVPNKKIRSYTKLLKGKY